MYESPSIIPDPIKEHHAVFPELIIREPSPTKFDTSPATSPYRTNRPSRIDTLKQGIQNTLHQKEKTKLDIEIEHFSEFRPYERFQRRMEKNHELEKSSRNTIISISKKKLIEKLTHDYQQDSEISRVMLYTYRWYFDEKEMFTLLLERFKTPIPLNLSPVEKKSFLDSVISKVQIKVLIFLKDWFKCYAHRLCIDPKLEEIFFELLYLMFTHPDTGKWIHLPISQLLSDLENIGERKEEDNVRSILKIASLPEIFVPLPIILSYSHLLAKQLCIVDIQNFKKIKVTEFYKKSWSKETKAIDAPNLTNIAEMSTRLSRMTSYLILMNKKNMIRVILYQYLIDLCDQLVRLRNFNSAFAIYFGLTSPAVQRLKSLLEPNLEKDPKDVFNNLKQLFSPSNNMEILRAKQNEVITPAVPFLGVYLGEIVYIDELPDYLDKDKKMLNFPKFAQLSEKINKVLTFKESYGFHKVDNILTFLKGIPAISEDQIYQLSYQILPL